MKSFYLRDARVKYSLWVSKGNVKGKGVDGAKARRLSRLLKCEVTDPAIDFDCCAAWAREERKCESVESNLLAVQSQSVFDESADAESASDSMLSVVC